MNVIPFQFQHENIRVIEQSGETWFVAKDVASILGYSNPRDAVNRYFKEGRETRLPTNSGEQLAKIIPERDVYRLIMRSKLPEAEKFEDWVVSDVLPSIRKTGNYSTADLSRMYILKLAMQAEEEKLKLQAQVAEDRPKVEAYHLIADSQGSRCITDAAKSLQLQPKALFAWLAANRWIYKRPDGKSWIGYQDNLQRGLLEHKVTTVNQRTVEQVRVTSKGLVVLAERLAPGSLGMLAR
ncbi:phage antirepressor KilAC domain-containing protein [Enterovibrio baiacu]|uniref:phage antirepressor KilAC domain-containing protein n=1 Tax=Enterovibrio baiacu TaxID=2491023 RepID=UPI001010F303|nr:phage antirepressor KilAC domain-containing protein [Enterovibrio baiacu]MBE1275642.1 phage antirepressor Ant [Enterovibrio baiacu]